MSYQLDTKISWHQTRNELIREFDRWGVDSWELQPSREPYRSEPQGVRVRFVLRGQEIRLEMASQNTAASNLRVLRLGIEAMRLNEVRGLAEVVQSAYLQLAAPTTQRDPYEVLGVRPDADLEIIEAAHRALAKRHHPDVGGSAEAMAEINAALERILGERR